MHYSDGAITNPAPRRPMTLLTLTGPPTCPSRRESLLASLNLFFCFRASRLMQMTGAPWGFDASKKKRSHLQALQPFQRAKLVRPPQGNCLTHRGSAIFLNELPQLLFGSSARPLASTWEVADHQKGLTAVSRSHGMARPFSRLTRIGHPT